MSAISLIDRFATSAQRFASQIPNFAAALLLLLAGMFLARTARTLADRLLTSLNLDEHTSKVGINEVLVRLGLGKSPSFALNFVIYWVILFIFMCALNKLYTT